ncbi:MAG: FkbM family methyltransferase [Bacteroidota bacterium]|jgi:FkbM family methyltransferase
MQSIKKLLYRILSEKQYLRLLHRVFYLLYDLGLLRNDKRFKYHYAVKKLIKPEYTVVDIGANLGYFSRNFARLAHRGKVISIEPVPQFFEILDHFMRKYPNSERYNVALGNEEGSITMVLPKSNGMIRTGLPHIAESEEEKKLHDTREVKIVKGSALLSKLDRLDYVKCDIEGYELNVFLEIWPLIEKFRPVVQLEIAEKNREEMLTMFGRLNYQQFGIVNFKLIEEYGSQQEEGDYLLIPSEHVNSVREILD